MWRYAIASLLIGLITSLVVLAFSEAGLSAWVGAHLHRLYRGSELTAIPGPPTLLPVLQVLAVVVSAFGVSWVALRVRRRSQALVVAALTVAVAALASAVLALYDILFEPAGAMVAALLAWAVTSIYARTDAARRKELFTAVVRGRVSDETMEKLAAAPFEAKPKGEMRGVSVVAVRVLEQARLCENLGAARALEVTNDLLASAAEFLVERGAHLDGFSPGGVRCGFGLPLPDAAHSATAVRSALALKEHLDTVSEELRGRYGEGVAWGCGLSGGDMATGLCGKGRFEQFGILSAEADFAWRLAGANENYGSSILVPAPTFQKIGDEGEFRPIDFLDEAPGGRRFEVYELIAEGGGLGEMASLRRDAFWRGVVQMRAGDYAAALAEFEEARVPGATDRPLEHFLASVSERLAGVRST